MNELKAILLNQTKRYCNRGIKIFPINYKSKIPMKDFKWKEMSTSNYEDIQSIVKDKNAFNLAMPTGKVNNIFVLDVDKGHNGFETLSKLEEELGKLPDTPTVITGGGGKHFYFKYPEGFKITGVACLLGDGVDTRTDNNYVVIPPSTHETGTQYHWEKGKSIFEIETKELPQAWIKSLVEASKKKQ